jgi:hypothetical protein
MDVYTDRPHRIGDRLPVGYPERRRGRADSGGSAENA